MEYDLGWFFEVFTGGHLYLFSMGLVLVYIIIIWYCGYWAPHLAELASIESMENELKEQQLARAHFARNDGCQNCNYCANQPSQNQMFAA